MEGEYELFPRPDSHDLERIMASLNPLYFGENRRGVKRLELKIPAEIRTARGNFVPAFTRDISRTGIGFIHRGLISPQQSVRVKIASDTREFVYDVLIQWVQPQRDGFCLSGGVFMAKKDGE